MPSIVIMIDDIDVEMTMEEFLKYENGEGFSKGIAKKMKEMKAKKKKKGKK